MVIFKYSEFKIYSMFQQLKKDKFTNNTCILWKRVFFLPWDLLPIFGSSRLFIANTQVNKYILIKIRYPFRRIRGVVLVSIFLCLWRWGYFRWVTFKLSSRKVTESNHVRIFELKIYYFQPKYKKVKLNSYN